MEEPREERELCCSVLILLVSDSECPKFRLQSQFKVIAKLEQEPHLNNTEAEGGPKKTLKRGRGSSSGNRNYRFDISDDGKYTYLRFVFNLNYS